jgi:hypothetical protein
VPFEFVVPEDLARKQIKAVNLPMSASENAAVIATERDELLSQPARKRGRPNNLTVVLAQGGDAIFQSDKYEVTGIHHGAFAQIVMAWA